jgi:thiosulfate dehydrogenase [quinone] large subunit
MEHRVRNTSVYSAISASQLLPLRIFMGFTFLYAGVQHLTDPSYFDPSKSGFIGHLISEYAVGSPIHDFLIGVVAPNAVTFGYMVAIGESLIGVAVLVGFLFRIAAFAGLLLNLTFFLSATWNAFPFYFGSDVVFAVCWLTLLLTGPQLGQSIDGVLAKNRPSLGWLATRTTQTGMPVGNVATPNARTGEVRIPLPDTAKLYPKQVSEVNRAFDRIKLQFISHRETQTILEFVRALVISLGVDRNDTPKILAALQNVINRAPMQETSVTQVM